MLWTKADLIICPLFLLISVIISFVLYLLLSKKDINIRRIPLCVITVILIILEVRKITSIYSEYGFLPSYLPFQFCSFFMFWSLFLLVPNKKIRSFGSSITMVWSIMIFVGTLINPGSVFGNASAELLYNHKINHSFIFHELINLYFILELFLKTTEYEKKFISYMPVATLFFACFAVPLSFIFNYSYSGVLGIESIEPLMNFIELVTPYVYAALIVIFGVLLVTFIYYCLFQMHSAINNKK